MVSKLSITFAFVVDCSTFDFLTCLLKNIYIIAEFRDCARPCGGTKMSCSDLLALVFFSPCKNMHTLTGKQENVFQPSDYLQIFPLKPPAAMCKLVDSVT